MQSKLETQFSPPTAAHSELYVFKRKSIQINIKLNALAYADNATQTPSLFANGSEIRIIF